MKGSRRSGTTARATAMATRNTTSAFRSSVRIRPRPRVELAPGSRFKMCDGGKRCRGEECTHAHSVQELEIWNDELEASRAGGEFSAGFAARPGCRSYLVQHCFSVDRIVSAVHYTVHDFSRAILYYPVVEPQGDMYNAYKIHTCVLSFFLCLV